MDVKELVESIGAEFYTGVPDSQLQALCNYLMNTYGIDPHHHVIAANEGNCTAMAAGYHLATGKIPVVYMQNSGIGNSVNPVVSLLYDKVYAIPCIFIVGWRGEPGEHDEPQHIFQGEVTIRLLEDMGITVYILDRTTTEADVKGQMERFRPLLARGKSVAFVVRKHALQYGERVEYRNDFVLKREEIIEHIARIAQQDIIVSTTGKASRELFEIRERNGESHQYDFLTVGSMGHSSSIALGIALNKPNTKIWCIDGDGAALMHMGAMAVIGANRPENLVHIVINNEAHETVGGMPTVGGYMDMVKIAQGCGYLHAVRVGDLQGLDAALTEAKKTNGLTFIEVKAAIGARSDLGRPTTTARENKESFMRYLNSFRYAE